MSWSVPELGTKELLNVAAPLMSAAEAIRFVFALVAATYRPDDASWMRKFP
jgi:hypothetical protein